MACIYVLKNNLMPGFCKVGISENVSSRVENLYGSWEIVRTWEMDMESARKQELIVKRKMKEFLALGHELFNCPLEYLITIIEQTVDGAPKDITDVVLPESAVTVRASVSEIGKLVRKVRKRQNMTIVEFSGISNVGYRFVSEMENGKPTCQMGKALGLLDSLGIKLYAHFSEPERKK